MVHESFNEHPMLHDILHLCLIDLVNKLTQARISQVHFPIYDPERSSNILPTLYAMLRGHFFESTLKESSTIEYLYRLHRSLQG